MALDKVTYVNGETVITAENLNEIQDAIIELEQGGTITVDSALSSTSENPVQNKVINQALGAKAPLASPTFTGSPKAPTAAAGTNNTQIATTAFVKTAIDNQLSTVYKAAGSVASIAALPAPSASYLGYVYDVESAFTTTADFVEGAGVDYPAGTDVAIIAVQSGGTTTYKYDALSGFVDLSGYIKKPASATAGQFLVYNGTDWAATTQWPEETVYTAGAVTQALDAGKLYHFTGALTALTITLNAAPAEQLAQYHFDFNCGSTAPTVTLPSAVILPDGNSFDANKHYEVDILNNYGAVLSWAIS